MQLTDALSRCPARASQEIKLDMRVDYIAFTKPWIENLKESTQRDPILATMYQITQQGWLHQRRRTTFSEEILGLQRRTINRQWNAPERPGLIIPGELQEEYLSRLHKGHL